MDMCSTISVLKKALNRSDASPSLSFSFGMRLRTLCRASFGFSNAGFRDSHSGGTRVLAWGRTLLIHGVTWTSRSDLGPEGESCQIAGAAAKQLATRRRGSFRRDASAAPHRQQAVRHRRRGLPTCRLRPSRVDPGPTTTQAPRDHRATAHRSGARRPRLPYLCAPAVSHTHSPSPLQRLPEHDVRRRAASRATRASSCRRLPVRAGIRR